MINRIKYAWHTLWAKYYITRVKINRYAEPIEGISGVITDGMYLRVNMDEVTNEWISNPEKAHCFGLLPAILLRRYFMKQDKKQGVTEYDYGLEEFRDVAYMHKIRTGKEFNPE